MVGQALPTVMREGLLFLTTAAVAVPVFQRLRISPVLGFLLAGIALGPFGIGGLALRLPFLKAFGFDDPRGMGDAAEFGVVFYCSWSGSNCPSSACPACAASSSGSEPVSSF